MQNKFREAEITVAEFTMNCGNETALLTCSHEHTRPVSLHGAVAGSVGGNVGDQIPVHAAIKQAR